MGRGPAGGGEEIFKKCNLKRFFWWLEWRINEFEGFMKTKLLGEMMTYVNIFAKYFVNHNLRDYAIRFKTVHKGIEDAKYLNIF